MTGLPSLPQFLWNMEANMYVDEEMKQRDPEIGDTLDQLADEIKAAMTGSALQFYEREFFFFRKVTNISGIIQPFPGASEEGRVSEGPPATAR